MLSIQKLIEEKTSIIETVIAWQKENYPNRTNNYDKCSRDIGIIYDAYIDDLKHPSTRNVTYVANRYWHGGERQIVDHNTEIAVHNFLVEHILNKVLLNETSENKQKLINLKNILINIIENGPEYTNYMNMHKYRYIMEYDTDRIPEEYIIKQCLHEAWETTPSKQQFMPYNIFVLGPGHKDRKEAIYYKSLVREYKTNSDRYDVDVNDPKAVESAMLKHRMVPQYLNFKTAPYVLICTQRVENQMNPWNQYFTDHQGHNFEQADSSWQKDPTKGNRSLGLSLIEIGMFIQTFSNLCLQHNIDISHTRCLPTTMEFWQEPEFNFLENPPQLLMTAGYGLKTRREFYPGITHGADYRPEFDRVVKFIA